MTRFDFREIDAEVGEVHLARRHVDVIGERMRDDFRLFVNFLRHEVAVITLVDQQRTRNRLDHGPVDASAGPVVDFDSGAVHHGPVAFIEIGDGVGKRRERNGIAAEIHFALAVADGEGRALARGDHQIVVAGEDDAEREGALELLQRRAHRLDRRQTFLHLVGDEMHDGFRVGIGLEDVAVAFRVATQFAEILDDAVVDNRDLRRHVRMGVALGRASVGCPARMSDARAARRAAR